MSIASIMRTVVKQLPKMEGSAGKLSLSKAQLSFMGDKGKEISKVLSDIGASSVDVAYKSKANYSIAAFRLRNGQKLVGQGAVSIQNPGTNNTILKYRAAVGENGKILTSNGYVNTGVAADSRDVALGFTRRGGNISYDTEIGKTFASHTKANEAEVTKLIESVSPNGKSIKSQINKKQWTLQQKMDEVFQKLRRIVKCEPNEYVSGVKHAFVKNGSYPDLKENLDLKKFKVDSNTGFAKI